MYTNMSLGAITDKIDNETGGMVSQMTLPILEVLAQIENGHTPDKEEYEVVLEYMRLMVESLSETLHDTERKYFELYGS